MGMEQDGDACWSRVVCRWSWGDVVVSPRYVQLGVLPVQRGHCFMLQEKEDREPQGRKFLLQEHRVNYAVIIVTRYDLFLLDPVPGWLVRLGRGLLDTVYTDEMHIFVITTWCAFFVLAAAAVCLRCVGLRSLCRCGLSCRVDGHADRVKCASGSSCRGAAQQGRRIEGDVTCACSGN